MNSGEARPGTHIVECGDQLILDTPSPGVVRAIVLLTLIVGGLMFAVSLGPMIGAVQWVFDFDLESALFELSSGWGYWILAALVLLVAGLLRMDSHCRRRVGWGPRQVRISWSLGPLELFVQAFQRAAVTALEVAPARPLPAGVQGPAVDGDQWLVIWRPASAGRTAGRELARLHDKADAEALLERLRQWNGQGASLSKRAPAVRASLMADLGNLGTHWLLRMPIFIMLGGCLMLVVLAVEGFASQIGLMAPKPFWHHAAESRLQRFEWRFVSETEVSGLSREAADPEFERVSAVLNYEVEFEPAGSGPQRRRVALPAPNLSEAHGVNDRSDSVAILLQSAINSGLVPEWPSYAIPRRLLDIEVDAQGVLRFDRLEFDSAAVGRLSTARSAFYDIVVAIDAPGRMLPVLWTQPTLAATERVMYRSSSGEAEPVWREADLQIDPAGLASLGGLGYFLGALGLFLSFSFVLLLAALDGRLTPGQSPLGALAYLALWLALCASTLVWVPMAPGMTRALGIDDLLLDRLRVHLVGLCCLSKPAELPAEPEGLIRGHWAPDGSRHRRWLEQLDLLTPPAQRYPGVESAQAALHEHIRTRLAAMDWPARRRFLARYLPGRLAENGRSDLNDGVIAPVICRWREEPEAAAEAMDRYAGVFANARCR